MTTPFDTSVERTLPLGSDPALRRRFQVLDAELPGNLRFGLLLEVLDKLAEDTALGYVRRFFPEGRVVTAAIDNIHIRHAADVTRDLSFRARINHVGRSSMEVGIRVEHPGGPPAHIASCYFTMVAREGFGDDAKSIALPGLDYTSDIEKQRAHKAVERRDNYRQQMAASLEPPTREEFDLLTGLHHALERPGFSGLLAGKLTTSSWERMYPEQENVPRKIFGGYLVRRAYELADICAERILPGRAIIVAVNRINFFQPVRMGDKLHYTARIVYTGEHSVCVEADIERTSLDRTVRALSNSCLFTFVHVDRNLIPQPVPRIYPGNYAEDALYLEAYRRHQSARKPKPQKQA
ncbi:MAG TPA: acyl-CoA thioesterase [Candidatus Deferrimicrobiaceae bacterium]|jgi:acyl-CoA hydrolase